MKEKNINKSPNFVEEEKDKQLDINNFISNNSSDKLDLYTLTEEVRFYIKTKLYSYNINFLKFVLPPKYYVKFDAFHPFVYIVVDIDYYMPEFSGLIEDYLNKNHPNIKGYKREVIIERVLEYLYDEVHRLFKIIAYKYDNENVPNKEIFIDADYEDAKVNFGIFLNLSTIFFEIDNNELREYILKIYDKNFKNKQELKDYLDSDYSLHFNIFRFAKVSPQLVAILRDFDNEIDKIFGKYKSADNYNELISKAVEYEVLNSSNEIEMYNKPEPDFRKWQKIEPPEDYYEEYNNDDNNDDDSPPEYV